VIVRSSNNNPYDNHNNFIPFYGAYNITSSGTVSNMTANGMIRPVSATLN